MDNDAISKFLTVILIVLVGILFVLLTVFIILNIKRKKSKDKFKRDIISDDNVIREENRKENKKMLTEYNKQSIFDFMEFDKVEDNMIIRKNGTKYIMAIECQGVNYDLMSGLEKNSVEQGFLQFLNTLRYQIQLYVQTRTVNLESSINMYKGKVDAIKNEYLRKQMEYDSIVNSGMYNEKQINDARFQLIKAQNLYEYGVDIIQNTEKMNLNKNILKKHYYVIISYIPEDMSKTDYDLEEIKNIAFSELYTRAQSIISSLSVCSVNGKILNSKELIELMYIAYNRDESEVYELEEALNAGFEELYSTASSTIEKRMRELDKQIERQANIKANEAVNQALDNIEKERTLKEKESQMNELINIMAKSILEENEEIIGTETKEEAEKIIDG